MHISHDFIATKTCPSYEFLAVFGQVRVWDRKSAVRARVGILCGAGAGAGKISQTLAGAERGGFKFCGCGAGADTKFQPMQDSVASHHQLIRQAHELNVCICGSSRTEQNYCRNNTSSEW